MQTAHVFHIHGSQRAYDDALPPDYYEADPPATLEGMADDLLWQEDTELLSFDDWAEVADKVISEQLADDETPRFMVRLFLLCLHSQDQQARDFVAAYREPLEQSARAEIGKAWKKREASR